MLQSNYIKSSIFVSCVDTLAEITPEDNKNKLYPKFIEKLYQGEDYNNIFKSVLPEYMFYKYIRISQQRNQNQ